MRVCRLAEVPIEEGNAVFRYSVIRPPLLALSLLAASGLLFVPRWRSPISYYIAGVLLLFILFTLRFITARFRPSNWLVRIAGNGVWIQFRSYLNYHLPAEDLTVVFLPFAEIQSVRLVRETSRVPSLQGSGSSTRTRRFIEFEVGVDTTTLGKVLAQEVARPGPPEKHWYGTSTTLYQHYPVRLAAPGFVQVEWGAVPGPKAFLAVLQPHIPIRPPLTVSEDLMRLQGLSRTEQEERLRKLSASGDKIAAVYLARRLYSFGLTEAEAFVDRLAQAAP